MREIPLRDRTGRTTSVALVDEDDFDRLSRHSWSLMGEVARRSVSVGGRTHTVLMHREVMGATFGDGLAVEHVNGNKLDNRRENLRVRPSMSVPSPSRPRAPVAAPWRPDTREPVR